MKSSISIIGLFVFFPACFSFPSVDLTSVTSTIEVNAQTPDELAEVHVLLGFSGDENYSAKVDIDRVDVHYGLQGSEATLGLELRYASDFDGLVVGGFEPAVELVNVGTTNKELLPLCGQPARLSIRMRYIDEYGDTQYPSHSASLTISCSEM